MVSRRKSRPNEGFRVYPTLPQPWGRVGPWQTGLYREAQAQQVEAWLHEMARMRPEVVDALVARRFSLQTAWIAKLRGTLDALLAGVNDPLLTDAVADYRKRCQDARALSGLDQLLGYAAVGVRLSWLAGKNIRGIYERAADAGRKPNSVRRSLHRAVSELLAYHVGEEARKRALRGVRVPGEDDTREVHLSAAEVRKLLDAAPEGFRLLLVAAIATAVDRKPLLEVRCRALNEQDGALLVPDRKTSARPRTIRLSGVALTVLRLAAAGKRLDDRLFPWSEGQVRRLWERTRTAAGLPSLRYKDLRHLLPTVLAEMGVDRREIQAYIGHAVGSKQTDRYITPQGDPRMLEQAAERLGIEVTPLVRVG